ncbi:hypothetical protein V8E55_007066 [Tylopilus felleus]
MTSHNSHYSHIPMSESPFYDSDQGTVGADVADLLADISRANNVVSFSRTRQTSHPCVTWPSQPGLVSVHAFIMAQELNNPFEYCDIVTTTTHEMLHSPQAGSIFSKRQSEYADLEK